MVETQSDEILRDAATEDVSLLVVGDPFGWVFLFPPSYISLFVVTVAVLDLAPTPTVESTSSR